MSDQVLFVYGSLLSPEVLKLVIGRVAAVELAVLEGYACYYVAGATFPAIIQEAGAMTHGKLLTGLSKNEIAALDRYEDTFYQRLPVVVKSDPASIIAMAYVVPETFRHVLSSKKWTWDEFKKDHLADYIARMRGV